MNDPRWTTVFIQFMSQKSVQKLFSYQFRLVKPVVCCCTFICDLYAIA